MLGESRITMSRGKNKERARTAAKSRTRSARSTDPRLRELARLVGELADAQCEQFASFEERSLAALRVAERLVASLDQENIDAETEQSENPED